MRISDWSSDVCSSDLFRASCCRLAALSQGKEAACPRYSTLIQRLSLIRVLDGVFGEKSVARRSIIRREILHARILHKLVRPSAKTETALRPWLLMSVGRMRWAAWPVLAASAVAVAISHSERGRGGN